MLIPSTDEQVAANMRALAKTLWEGRYGADIQSWPQSAQVEYHQLQQTQNEYEQTYCEFLAREKEPV